MTLRLFHVKIATLVKQPLSLYLTVSEDMWVQNLRKAQFTVRDGDSLMFYVINKC